MVSARLTVGTRVVGLVWLLVACAGCTQRGAGPGDAASASPVIPVAATVRPAATRLSPTAAVVLRVLAGPSPQITPDMTGQTVQVAAGQSFLVNLGGDVDWLVTWTPADAVRPVLTTVRPAGSQGYFIADEPGRTVLLTARGPRICPTPPTRAATPCAPGAISMFRATVVSGPPQP